MPPFLLPTYMTITPEKCALPRGCMVTHMKYAGRAHSDYHGIGDVALHILKPCDYHGLLQAVHYPNACKSNDRSGS